MTLQEFEVDEFLNEFEVYMLEDIEYPKETLAEITWFLELNEIDYKILDWKAGTFAADMSGYQ